MIEVALSPREYAERLGIHADKVRAWIMSGELMAVNTAQRRGGKPRWKIPAESIAAFEASRGAVVPDEPKPKRQRRLKRDEKIIQYF